MNAARLDTDNRAGIEIANKQHPDRSNREVFSTLAEAQNSSSSMDAIEWFRAEFKKRLRKLGPVAPVMHQWLFGSAEVAYRQFLQNEGPLFPAAVRTLRLDYRCSPEEPLRVPPTGPVIVVANHPYGVVEVLLLGTILSEVRRDFRFLATSDAMLIPPIREFIIPIARRREPRSGETNSGSIRAAVQWLRSGGLVVVFPAGRVATRRFPTFKLTEQPWADIAAVLARWSDAAVVPAFFHGCNHWIFYAAGLLHRDLTYIALFWEGLRRRPRVVDVSIGTPIHVQPLIEQLGLKHATAHLRSRTLGMSMR